MTVELKYGAVPTEPGYYFVMYPDCSRPTFALVEMATGQEIWNSPRYVGLVVGCEKLTHSAFREGQWSEKLDFRASLRT